MVVTTDFPRPLGPYLLEAKLGQGGMADVFRARTFGASGFEKVIVIKTLREDRLGDARLERMFLDEARLQARFSHKNLVQAHDLGIADGRPWVRLDWVEGADLSRFHLPLPAALASLVVSEIALGLIAIHEAVDDAGLPLAVVHRDISPKNVLISRLGEVKLADFGIARATLLREETRAGVRKGTYAYMSPEQVSGLPLTPASDQFALATLAVELFTGARPFDGTTPLDTMDRIRAGGPSLSELPPALRPAFQRAFSVDPGQRFRTLREFRKELLATTTRADELALAAWVDETLSVASPAATPSPTRVDTDAK